MAGKLRQPIEQRPLTFEYFCASGRQREPFGAVDFGKHLNPAAPGRPLHFEGIAGDRSNVEIAVDRKGNDALAATLTDFAEWFESSSRQNAKLFHKLPAGSDGRVLPGC
jgi:hypothetical protein